MSVWFTSDLHIGHPKIAELRGFSTVKEHDDTIIHNISSKLLKRDKLFILGDVVWKPMHLRRLDEISCYKELLFGNHDKLSTKEYMKYFQKLHGFVRYKNFWLSHCPIHPQEIHRCMGNIHGHIHNKAATKPLDKPYYCVNLDFHDLFPVQFETIRDSFEEYHTKDIMKDFKRPEELINA